MTLLNCIKQEQKLKDLTREDKNVNDSTPHYKLGVLARLNNDKVVLTRFENGSPKDRDVVMVIDHKPQWRWTA